MIRTKDVRAQFGASRDLISRYRRAGLFPYDPIAVSHGGLWRDRVYPEEALTILEILEGLRKRGFDFRATRVLFLTLAVSEGTRDYISFDDEARLVIAPERIEEAKAIIKAVVSSYDRGYRL